MYVKLVLKNYAIKYLFNLLIFFQILFLLCRAQPNSLCTCQTNDQMSFIFYNNNILVSHNNFKKMKFLLPSLLNCILNFFDEWYFLSKYFNYQVIFGPYFCRRNSLSKDTAKWQVFFCIKILQFSKIRCCDFF